ncbi:hypothetical protein CL6EHI_062550 [Entamoeba histolytica]|uniref:PPM-type phosphatase domain-containing protein n=1 Tax=Entamoeba histolytica TaxID=5759 RepID=A0A175JNC3_ENTHI|nr:hypothetical protein CL6EHI_062550 [Entamoeba histolytica]
MKGDSKKSNKKTFKLFYDSLVNDLNQIQSYSFIKPDITPVHAFVSGEYDPIYPVITSSNHYAFTSMSTYPIINGKKIGNPICDYYQLLLYNNTIIQCLCDGCGIGIAPKLAATAAGQAAVQSIAKEIRECSNIKEIAENMIRAISDAHDNIFVVAENERKSYLIGATTIQLQVIVQLDSRDRKFGIITLNIGDCRSYLYSNSTLRTIYNYSSRESLSDVSNSQGRIGNGKEGMPDLGNASLTYNECYDGDLIFMCSDGINDNFDPEIIGVSSVGERKDDKIKSIENSIGQYIIHSNTLSETIESIGEYVVGVTTRAREVQSTPQTPTTPKGNRTKAPGKLDHSTMALVRIELRNDNDFFYIDSFIPSYNYKINPNVSDTTMYRRSKIRREHPQFFVINKDFVKPRTSSMSRTFHLKSPIHSFHSASNSASLSPSSGLCISPLDLQLSPE